jgi:Phosphatidylethanolamine-binding protein
MAAERGRGDSIILFLVADFALQSSAFDHGGPIPRRHNCEGEHLSPPLAWSGAPEGTRSLALVVDDPDAPAGTLTHWLAWALDPRRHMPRRGGGRPGRGAQRLRHERLPRALLATRHGRHRYCFRLYRSTPIPVCGPTPARAPCDLAPLRLRGWADSPAAERGKTPQRRPPLGPRPSAQPTAPAEAPATPHGRCARPPAARPAPGPSRARAGNRLPVCCGSGAVRPPAPASGAAGRRGRRRCASSLLRSAIARRCHRPTESARAARQGPAAGATDAERTRGTTTLRVRPVNSESRPRGRLPPDRLSSAPPVRPVRPVTCPADRAPPAAASRPAVPVALSLGSLGFPYRPGTHSLSSQPPATPSLFWGTGVQGVGQDARQG